MVSNKQASERFVGRSQLHRTIYVSNIGHRTTLLYAILWLYGILGQWIPGLVFARQVRTTNADFLFCVLGIIILNWD